MTPKQPDDFPELRQRAAMTLAEGLVYGDAAQHGLARRDVRTVLTHYDTLRAELDAYPPPVAIGDWVMWNTPNCSAKPWKLEAPFTDTWPLTKLRHASNIEIESAARVEDGGDPLEALIEKIIAKCATLQSHQRWDEYDALSWVIILLKRAQIK